MRKMLVITLVLLCVLTLTAISAENTKETITRLEAENADGRFITADDARASNGKFVGIDHTLNAEQQLKYILIYENAPAATSVRVFYATPHTGKFIISIDNDGVLTEVGQIDFTSSGDWYPVEGIGVMATGEVNIPEGSKVVITVSKTVNLDYFEFINVEEIDPETEEPTEPPVTEEPTNPSTSDDLTYIFIAVLMSMLALTFLKRSFYIRHKSEFNKDV